MKEDIKKPDSVREIINNIGFELRRDREKGELVVAEACNVHQTTVSSWIKNNRIPDWHWTRLIELSEGKLNANILMAINYSKTN